jgi:peroxiredoxin
MITAARYLSITVFLALAVVTCGKGAKDNCKTIGDFQLETMAHDRFYLSQHRGRVVMLVFWATDCRECIKELGALNPLRKELPSDRLMIASVCIDPHNFTDIRRIVADLQLDLPVLLDRNAELKTRIGLRGVPSTVLIGPDSRIASIHYGYSPALFRRVQNTLTDLLEAEVNT